MWMIMWSYYISVIYIFLISFTRKVKCVPTGEGKQIYESYTLIYLIILLNTNNEFEILNSSYCMINSKFNFCNRTEKEVFK